MKQLLLTAAAFCTLLFFSFTVQSQRLAKAKKQLKELEEKWHAAFLTHDTTVLTEILSGDFILVDRTGRRIGKQEVIKNFTADESVYENNTPYDMEFRIYKNTAIVLGKSKEKGSDRGKMFEATYFWKDIFLNIKVSGAVYLLLQRKLNNQV